MRVLPRPLAGSCFRSALWTCFIVAWAATPSSATEWYVAPLAAPNGTPGPGVTAGSPSGAGTMASPIDLQTALYACSSAAPASPPAPACKNIVAGDVVWLLEGTYRTDDESRFSDSVFKSYLQGTESQPIIVKAYDGKRATLDGKIRDSNGDLPTTTDKHVLNVTNGGDVHFVELEITNSETDNRSLSVTGSDPDRRRGTGIFVSGMQDKSQTTPRVKIINCVIHDNSDGIGFWRFARDGDVYGTISYHNGWDAPDRPHGHGIYNQHSAHFTDNGVVTSRRVVENSIFWGNFGNEIDIYMTQSEFENIELRGNGVFGGRSVYWAGGIPTSNVTVRDNHVFKGQFSLGSSNESSTGMLVRNNKIFDTLSLAMFKDVVVQNNLVWNPDNDASVSLTLNAACPNAASDYTFTHNRYYPTTASFPFANWRVKERTSATCPSSLFTAFQFVGWDTSDTPAATYENLTWQGDYGFDLDGRYLAAQPTTADSYLKLNRYDLSRGTLFIYNWDEDANVTVNLPSLLKQGDSYELRNVQDYYDDVITGTAGVNGAVTVPMTGRTVATPVGWTASSFQASNAPAYDLEDSIFPKYGVFVVVNTSASRWFADVSESSSTFEAIFEMRDRGITDGCGVNGSGDAIFCPTSNVTRGAAAVFLARAMRDGDDFEYDAVTPEFPGDVPTSHPFFKWIQEIGESGISDGCGVNGSGQKIFCPDTNMKREEMAVFLVRAVLGTDTFSYCSQPFFSDVAATHPQFKYIQKLRELNVTTGCSASNYCPTDNVSREHMSLFLGRAMGWFPTTEPPPACP